MVLVAAIDLNVTRFPSEGGACGVESVGEDVFFFEEEELGGVGVMGLGLGVCVFGVVAD